MNVPMDLPASLAPSQYRVTHRTEYVYGDSVAICQNQLRMLPRTLEHVRCLNVATEIQPRPDFVDEYADFFGNRILSFAIESLHRKLSVTVTSTVEVATAKWMHEQQSPAWESIVEAIRSHSDPNWARVGEFVRDSPQVKYSREYAEYAKSSFAPNRGVIAATLDLTQKIHREFRYDTTATQVDTPTAVAFQKRAGVCQDFAHIQISCLRSIGLPARYVSGYLRTLPPPGKPRLVGTDESHAWLSLYAGPDVGWVDFDPTNACIPRTEHIPICVGRDYDDVSPMRGVVLGGGQTQLSVSVDVNPL